MDRHVRNLGNLSIAFGIVATIIPLFLLIFYGGFGSMYDSAEDRFTVSLIIGSLITHLILGAPMIFAGVAIRKFQNWARSAMIVLCAVNLLNVPFGSLLGIYGLWVLLTPETEPLFLDPPRSMRTRQVSRAAAQDGERASSQLKRAEPDLSE